MNAPKPIDAHRVATAPVNADAPGADHGVAAHVRSFNARRGRMGRQLQSIWRDGRAEWTMPDGSWVVPPRTVLEIGSGMGDNLLAIAPEWDLVIGVDVHVRGLAATIRAAQESSVTNLRVVPADIIDVLNRCVPEASLGQVQVWFPDPWPRRSQRKRRLIQPAAVQLLARRLRPGGALRLATDDATYAADMIEVIGRCDLLRPLGDAGLVERPESRPVTRFEAAARCAGRAVSDLAFIRT